MIYMKVNQAKSLFLDRDAVTSRVDAVEIKTMSKAGGLVRKIAQRSMRYLKGYSTAGSPPNAHAELIDSKDKNGKPRKKRHGALLRELLFYIYDASSRSVVIGPAQLNQTTDAPHTEEFGGTVSRNVHGKVTTATYPARPYMGPALTTASPNLPDVWKDAVTK